MACAMVVDAPAQYQKMSFHLPAKFQIHIFPIQPPNQIFDTLLEFEEFEVIEGATGGDFGQGVRKDDDVWNIC